MKSPSTVDKTIKSRLADKTLVYWHLVLQGNAGRSEKGLEAGLENQQQQAVVILFGPSILLLVRRLVI